MNASTGRAGWFRLSNPRYGLVLNIPGLLIVLLWVVFPALLLVVASFLFYDNVHPVSLYARWDYVDRYNMQYMSLWSTLPDGSNAQAVFGNYTVNPHCVFEARRIPDSLKMIFTASGHHAFTGGSLVLLDAHRAADGEAAMTRLTPEVCFPESEGWPQTYFAGPFPLSENHYLTAWSAQPLPPGTPRPAWGMPGPPNDLGLYLFDAFGNLNLIYRDPEIGSETPLPIRRRVPERLVSGPADGRETTEGRMIAAGRASLTNKIDSSHICEPGL